MSEGRLKIGGSFLKIGSSYLRIGPVVANIVQVANVEVGGALTDEFDVEWEASDFLNASTDGILLIAVYNRRIANAPDVPNLPTISGATITNIQQLESAIFDVASNNEDSRLTLFSAELTEVSDSGIHVDYGGQSNPTSNVSIVFVYNKTTINQSKDADSNSTQSVTLNFDDPVGAGGFTVVFFRAVGQVGASYEADSPLEIVPDSSGAQNLGNLTAFWADEFVPAPRVEHGASPIACALTGAEVAA